MERRKELNSHQFENRVSRTFRVRNFASPAPPAIISVAAILSAEKARTRRRGHVRYGNPARSKLFLPQTPFVDWHCSCWSFPRRAFLVEQRRSGGRAEVRRNVANSSNDSVSTDCRMGLHFSSASVPRRIRHLYMVAREVERVGLSLGEKLAFHAPALHRPDRFRLYRLAPLHRALADTR